ncbi:MAG: HAD-IC family P-type ATPase, partial [Phenylobacterium sp.]|nr:HAD-IC family P-type ATPase [Phenylobacterium sp.]
HEVMKTKRMDGASPTATRRAWYALESAEALERLESSENGLASDEAARRLEEHGANRLAPPAGKSPLLRFLSHFHNMLIYLLLVAAVVTALLGHWVDTGVIMGVVFINSFIGFMQEGKAERALDAIRNLLSLKAMLLRDGRKAPVPAEEIVPGDIVLLQSGDKVPADLRLIKAKNLRIDESILTGESVAASKHTDCAPEPAALGDQRSMAFSGTLVTYGQATGVVTATGEQTEIGRISAMLSDVEPLATPLIQKMSAFGRVLAVVIIGVAAVTFSIGVFVHSFPAGSTFLAAVSLAVAAIPEGLPAIMTITLSIGVQRMAGRHAIIRHLPAVDTLGAVTTICSDKTGTLTRNEMTARSVHLPDQRFTAEGVGYAPRGQLHLDGEAVGSPAEHPALLALLETGLLCNDASLREDQGQWHIDGDPTEGALLVLAQKAGLDPEALSEAHLRLDSIPFESEHRYMATLNGDGAGGTRICVKGAPERILDMCTAQGWGEDECALDRAYWEQVLDGEAQLGQRLLAVAYRTSEPDRSTLDMAVVEGGLTLLGVVGIIDPPRDEAIRAIAECQSAGIRVKMITGDHADTAAAIAAALKQPGHAIALVPLRPLLAQNGVLERLRGQGFTVKTPGEE